MLIIQINTRSTEHCDKLIEQIRSILDKEDFKVYTGEEASISKRIPIYDTEDLKENLKKQKTSDDERKIGCWQKRYRYANIWHFRCSVCEKTSPHSQYETPVYSFCPHCSSEMQASVGDRENA